ncbi:MAG: CopG family transcriptional regulator [Actinomycetota bacterium]|nr:CopG family transcriptional regulator [Actinomycetota bacterium]
MARPRSFRFDESLLANLEERARARGESATSVAERYLAEGLRRDDHPLIVFREGAAGRRPALVGTRLDVAHVIDTLRGSDNSVEATAEYLALPTNYVRAAVRYYADFQDEVDEWRERIQELADREEDAWRREQAVLA